MLLCQILLSFNYIRKTELHTSDTEYTHLLEYITVICQLGSHISEESGAPYEYRVSRFL
jgi:hypothetical protein